MQSAIATHVLGRRAFLVTLTGSAIALSACAKIGSKSISADEIILNEFYRDKLEILSAISMQVSTRSDLTPVFASITEQTNAHLNALTELLDGKLQPMESPTPSPNLLLSQLLVAKANEHATKSIQVSSPETSRVLIQICASENVQAGLLSGLAA